MPIPRKRRPLPERFWASVLKTEHCWLWIGHIDHKGYGEFTLEVGRKSRAHRFAYELSFGLILPGLHCLHTCDVRHCVRPDHLFLGTQGDNMRDMVRKGRDYQHANPERILRGDKHPARLHPERLPRGEQHVSAKLKESQVREIRRLHTEEGWTYQRLASRFGVHKHMIYLIVTRKAWKHVP
jgi:hypothetical protein